MLKVEPEINRAFVEFYRVVFAEGALDRKTKELIALAVSLMTGCERCFESHVLHARRQGASDLEIREAIAVAELLAVGKVRSMVAESSIAPQLNHTPGNDE